jgi:hypothetical protein
MKQFLIIFVLASPAFVFAQGRNASSSAFRERAEADVRRELQEALKKEDWTLVKEDADELAKLKNIRTEQSKPKKVDMFESLQKAGFSLSRGPDNGDEKKGASFAFTQDRAAGFAPVFTADFYLKWEKEVLEEIDTISRFDFLAISVQGKLSSKDSSSTDAWRFRLENNFFTQDRSKTSLVDGFVANLSLKDESDRDFNIDRVSGELWLTANKRNWWVGKYSGTPDSKFAQVRWRPYVGLDAGGNVSNTTGQQIDNSNLWLMARGRLDIRLNFLINALKFQDVVAYFDDKYVYLAENGQSHDYLTTGIDFEFNDNVGFTLDYTNGEDSPKFKREEILKGGLTVKF